MARPKNPGGGNGGNSSTGKPAQTYGSINAGNGISSAQQAATRAARQGRPTGSGQPSTTTPASTTPTPQNRPAKPTAPPTPDTIQHSDASQAHIIEGDGGRQGGHLAGTGLSKKTEFPQSWDRGKILDAAYQVTQQGPPSKGPYPTKDASGKPAWAYDYTGTVDGVTVKTTVLADGEIRTAYPSNSADPGVITNPPAPTPPPTGVPVGEPPHYSHPALGGDGSWTWEGPKSGKVIRVVQDDQGNVTRTELGDYKKK